MGYTSQDRDLVIRTALGEAANQGEEGQAAVIHTILNRVKHGSFGKSPTQVVLAPNQFEPWQTRAKELVSISPNSEPYQNVGKIYDKVISGEMEDPTGGATHFLQPDIVRKRRGGTLPKWAQGEGIKIGEHVFYNPNGDPKNKPTKVASLQQDVPSTMQETDYINNFKSKNGKTSNSQTEDEEVPDFISRFKPINKRENEVLLKTQAAVEGEEEIPDFISRFKSSTQRLKEVEPQNQQFQTVAQPGTIPGQQVAASAQQAPRQYMIGAIPFNEADLIKTPTKGQEGPQSQGERVIQQMRELPNQMAHDYLSGANEKMVDAAGQFATGMNQIASNKPVTGLGNVAMGVLGYPSALITGAEKPIEKITGNKDFASKATLFAPIGPGGKIANEARPMVRAANDIVKDIGVENLPSVIKRLESNPKLTVMDVAPAVQVNAAGLATDARNAPALSHLNNFQRKRMNERKASTISAFEDVLGPTPNVADTIKGLKEQAAKTGKEAIEPAIASMKPVNVSNVVESIDKQFSPEMLKSLKSGETPRLPMTEGDKELWKLRERVAGSKKNDEFVLDPQAAHEIQQELRVKYGHNYDARNIRRQLIDQMEASSAEGKSFKEAQKKYAGDKQIEEAYKHGFEVFANPTGGTNLIENHPDMWNAWAADASKAELDAVEKGILGGAHARIMNMRNGNMIPEGGFTHERIASIVGEERAQKIVDKLNDWRDISQTDNLLTKNSATAARQSGQQNRKVRDVGGPGALQRYTPAVTLGGLAGYGSGSALAGLAAVAGLSGAQRGAQYLGKLHDISSNTAYAKWAAAQGTKREELLDILREAARKSQPTTLGSKLMNLVPSSVVKALPQ